MRRQNNQSPRYNSANGQNDPYYNNSKKLNVVETCTIENDCCCKCGGKKQQQPQPQPQPQQQAQHQVKHSNLQGEISQIDDDTLRALLALRQKACQFINSETEHTTTSESVPRSNNYCPCQAQPKDEKYLIRIEDLLEYSPQSQFLKKLKKHFQGYSYDQCVPNVYNESNQVVPTPEECNEDSRRAENFPSKKSEKECKCCKCSEKDKLLEKTPKSSQDRNEKLKRRASTGKKSKRSQEKKEDPCQDEYSAINITYRKSTKKSQHVSRPRKLVKRRSRRKKRSESGDKQSSQEYFEPSLKRPHEDSCERCWRYASASRSPVNKPDQRYNPNFRRAHSWQDFSTVKESASEFYSSEILDKNTGPNKIQEPLTKDFDFPSAQKPQSLNNYTTSRINDSEVKRCPPRTSEKNYQNALRAEEVKRLQTSPRQQNWYSPNERKPRPKSYTLGVSPRNADREMSSFFEDLDCTEYKEIQTKKSSPKGMASPRSMRSSPSAIIKMPLERKENVNQKTKTKIKSPRRKRDVKGGKQLPDGTTGSVRYDKVKQKGSEDAEWLPLDYPPRAPDEEAEWLPGFKPAHHVPGNDNSPPRIPKNLGRMPGVRASRRNAISDNSSPRALPDDAEWIPGFGPPNDSPKNDNSPVRAPPEDAEWISGFGPPSSSPKNDNSPGVKPTRRANDHSPPRAPPDDADCIPSGRHHKAKNISPTRYQSDDTEIVIVDVVPEGGGGNYYPQGGYPSDDPDIVIVDVIPEGGGGNYYPQRGRPPQNPEWVPNNWRPQGGGGNYYPQRGRPPQGPEWVPNNWRPQGGGGNYYPQRGRPSQGPEWIPNNWRPQGGGGNYYPQGGRPSQGPEWFPDDWEPPEEEYIPPPFRPYPPPDAEWIPGFWGPTRPHGGPWTPGYNYSSKHAAHSEARTQVTHGSLKSNKTPPCAPPKNPGLVSSTRVPHDNSRNVYSSLRASPNNAERMPRSDFVGVDFNKSSICLPNPPPPQSNMYNDTTHSKAATNKSSSRYIDSNRTPNKTTQKSASPKTMYNNQMPTSGQRNCNEVPHPPKSQSTHAFQNKYLSPQQRPRTVDHSDPRYNPRDVPKQKMKSEGEYNYKPAPLSYPPHEMRPCLCRQDMQQQKMATNYSSDSEPKRKEYCCHCRRRDSSLKNNYNQNDLTYNIMQSRLDQTKEFEKMNPKYYAVNSCRCTEWQEPFPYTASGGEKGKIVLCPFNENKPEKYYDTQGSAFPDNEKNSRSNQGYSACPELEQRNAPGRRGQSNFTNYVPTNYCVFYMRKNDQNNEDEVEVLVEELTEKPIGRTKKDCRTQAIEEKMRKIAESRSNSESMALRFQKGLNEVTSDPKSIRTLYF